MKELIRHILKEETIDLSQNLMRLFDKTLVKENSDVLCSISVKQIGKSYSVTLFVKIGVFRSVRERLMNDAWNMVYDVTGRLSEIHQRDCEKKDNIQEDVNGRKLKLIKKYMTEYVKHIDELKGEVCEILVQMDGSVIVVDIYINDERYDELDNEYTLYMLKTRILYKVSEAFGMKRNKLITYIEKCSAKRETYERYY
jgi:hypothetical protein